LTEFVYQIIEYSLYFKKEKVVYVYAFKNLLLLFYLYRIKFFYILNLYIMPWKKIDVDDVIDVKSENERTIGRVLENLDRVQCMYTQMRASGFIFETNILQLVERLDTEGGQSIDVSLSTFCFPYQSQVDHYNTLLCDFMNQISLFLTGVRSNKSGVGAPLIGEWSASNNCAGKTTTYYVQFKQPGYVWNNCQPACIIDNVKVNGSCETCPTATVSLSISIGCSAVAATILNVAINGLAVPDAVLDGAGDNPTFNAFRDYLCTALPAQIHQLLSHFTKNIELIDNCIKSVNGLVETFDLL
jgi:hypothetical protein